MPPVSRSSTKRTVQQVETLQVSSKNSSTTSLDKFAHLNDFNNKNPFQDSGNFPHVHYKTKVNPIRFKIRAFLLPYVRSETPILSQIQETIRTPFLDYYFSYSANLAAHTFYVLMLPLPIWLGYGQIGRDLVYILGFGIYASGFVKDFCCLPRPRSPPLHRITLSGYTAKEYGFPSSHSANATGVSVYLLMLFLRNTEGIKLIAGLFILAVYYCSLIFGRIYCGMHGFADLSVGATIGVLVFGLRRLTSEYYDSFVFQKSLFGIVTSLIFNYCLIYFHVSPVDDCPCYDDSVAFIGVIMGIDISHWIQTNRWMNSSKFGIDGIDIPYSYAEIGFIKTLLRITLGVFLVVVWKEISKPILLTLFKPVYRLIVAEDKEKITFNRIRSDTLNKKERIGDLTQMLKDIGAEKKDSVGPQSSIDITEIEEDDERYKKELSKLHQKNTIFTCGAFKKRYDIEIIVRLIVYAGIPFMVTIGFPLVAPLAGLGYTPELV